MNLLRTLVFLASLYSPEVLAQIPKVFDCARGIELSSLAKIDVYIFSHPGCGYCRRAFIDIGAWGQNKSINIIAMDVSGKIEKIKANEELSSLYQKYNIQLVDASPCGEKYSLFIPKIYFFKSSTEIQIKKMKGWGKGDIAKVQKTLQKYS